MQNRGARLVETLAAIEIMDLDQLRALWAQHFGTPPSLRSVDLMRLVLGWRLQARTYGGIDASMRRKLKRKTMIEAGNIDLAVGTTLTREWQGKTYEIEVLEGGFDWEGETYPSLSAVASAITGTRWNGPRFFGLRGGKP
ncbi:hypothetical protein SZ64_10570 [Erythrobacter sp. SG61-1L]|nr:hypothetical protein SZ64_10570 [Erythrobacter sp. SG61-1L]